MRELAEYQPVGKSRTKAKRKRVYSREELDQWQARTDRAVQQGFDMVKGQNKPKNVHAYIQSMRHVISELLESLDFIIVINKSMSEAADALDDFPTPNQNLRWDQQEDEALVYWRAEGDSLTKVAKALGRTPAACATRLSTLTGIPRADLVRMYVDGALDGEQVRGLFEGRAERLGKS